MRRLRGKVFAWEAERESGRPGGEWREMCSDHLTVESMGPGDALIVPGVRKKEGPSRPPSGSGLSSWGDRAHDRGDEAWSVQKAVWGQFNLRPGWGGVPPHATSMGLVLPR